MNNGETGGILAFEDCAALYPRLKKNEAFLSEGERKVLVRIEKVLYASLSINQMEELLETVSAGPDAPWRM